MSIRLPYLILATLLATATGLSAAAGDPAAEVSDTFRPYQLEHCLVSGQPLGSMGDGVSVLYRGQELTVCCAGCLRKLRQEPEVYLGAMRERAAERAEVAPDEQAAPEATAPTHEHDHAAHDTGAHEH